MNRGPLIFSSHSSQPPSSARADAGMRPHTHTNNTSLSVAIRPHGFRTAVSPPHAGSGTRPGRLSGIKHLLENVLERTRPADVRIRALHRTVARPIAARTKQEPLVGALTGDVAG